MDLFYIGRKKVRGNQLRDIIVVVIFITMVSVGYTQIAKADEVLDENKNVTTQNRGQLKENETTTKLEVQETTTKKEQETTTKAKKQGFYKTKKKKTVYYKDGKKHKGFLKYKKKTYYFNKKGYMVTGFVKIKKDYYYFNSKGVMKTGFVTRKYKKKKIKNYYAKKGILKTGKFKVGSVTYWATKKNGEIYAVLNRAEAICQRPTLPTGCEITSWTMMANYAGVNISKTTAANVMPRSSDPNRGFMGSPYSSGGSGLIVYPLGLESMTKKYLGSFVNMTGCKYEQMKSKLYHKHLVLVWVKGLDGFLSHTVALTGYDKEGFFYNDPWTGTKRKISYSSFFTMWLGNGKRAMSY